MDPGRVPGVLMAMPINPQTHALPAYLLLQGLTRLVALFFVALACGIFASNIVEALFRYPTLSALFNRLTNVYIWSPLAGLLPIATLLWLNSTRVARWCTPRIDLSRCQVCGYRLGDDRRSPCPECGYQDPTTSCPPRPTIAQS